MHTTPFIFIICCTIFLNGGYGVEVPHFSTSTSVPSTTSNATTASTTTASTTKPTGTTATTKTTSTTTTTKTTSTATSTVAPITTPKPSVPPRNFYTVKTDNTLFYCLIMNVSIQIEVSNLTTYVPSMFTTTGLCGKNESLTVSWSNNMIIFEFNKHEGKYEITSINLNFDNAAYKYDKVTFPVSVSESYKCDKVQSFELINMNNTEKARLHMSQLQYQAFMNNTTPVFSTAWDCNTANTPDVVPIVVGCILAVLVILILVAYLFGRRRCQAHGYLSMFSNEGNDSDYIPMKTLSCFK